MARRGGSRGISTDGLGLGTGLIGIFGSTTVILALQMIHRYSVKLAVF